MVCKKPFSKGGMLFGCGQCLPCRINRTRLWTHRIMLESYMHKDNSFVTLTYDDKNLPKDGSLKKRHYVNFMKKLRRKLPHRKIRYYMVGEYGEQSGRPHFHFALFGYPNCIYGRTRHVDVKKKGTCCPPCDLIRERWNKGSVDLGELNSHTAQYIGGYITKKWTKVDDSNREALGGRQPEFAKQSNRPGIAADAMRIVADALTTDSGARSIIENGDVPFQLQHGSKKWPLGRYLRTKLREVLGFYETSTPKETLKKISFEMSILQNAIIRNTPDKKKAYKEIQKLKNDTDRIASIEARYKIYKQRRNI